MIKYIFLQFLNHGLWKDASIQLWFNAKNSMIHAKSVKKNHVQLKRAEPNN